MKKIFVIALLSSVLLLEAVSPSLPESDHEFIKQYCLPAWKYIDLNMELAISGDNRKFTHYNENEQYEFYKINYKPTVFFRKESDKMMLKCFGYYNIDFQYKNDFSYHYTYDDNELIKSIMQEFRSDLHNEAELKLYNKKSDYIVLSAIMDYNYFNQFYSEENHENSTILGAFLAGSGSGRVREVTPIIRALRFKKRYNSFGKGVLDQQDVANLSGILTKYSENPNNFEYSDKYWWNDISSILNNKLSNLDGYDVFMLTDALKENVGTRLQGKEMNVNLQYFWIKQKNDYWSGNYNLSRINSIFSYIGLTTSGKYYSNLSIKHQIGFEMDLGLYLPTSENTLFDRSINLKLNHNQLFTITDRLIYQVDFNIFGDMYKKNKGFLLEALNSFNYYLENNFSINLNINSHFQKYDQQSVFVDFDRNGYYRVPHFYDGAYREFLWWDFGVFLNYHFGRM